MGDMEFARRFGARPILVLTGDGKNTLKRPDLQTLEATALRHSASQRTDNPFFQGLEKAIVCDNLTEAVKKILKD
jgi:hypothetical protein